MNDDIFDEKSELHVYTALLEPFTLVPLDISLEQEQLIRGWQNEIFSAHLSQTLPTPVLPSSSLKPPISILLAYANEDARLLPKVEQLLTTFLQQGYNIGWQSEEIHLSNHWENRRENYLSSTDLLLLFITPAFISSKYCYCKPLSWAIDQHCKKTYVLPILLKACIWDETPFAVLPTITPNRKAVDEWPKSSRAFVQIGLDIREAIKYLQARR